MGKARDTQLDADIARMYSKEGMTIRDIAAKIGKSYGFVHSSLRNNPAVTLRPRGFAKKPATTSGQVTD